MKPQALNSQDIPLKMVGSNHYGRYPKISNEQTFNMIISDGWLVNYPGYRVVANISNLPGRALFSSERWGNMIAVFGNAVWGVNATAQGSSFLSFFFLGTLNTFSGDVFIDENIGGEIALCDGQEIYIFNWQAPTVPAIQPVVLPVDTRTGFPIVPGYITYQDGYFITINEQSASWFLSAQNQGTNWNWSNSGGPVTASIQTKATNAVAVLRAPSMGNLLFVFGTSVTELWYDVGEALFPYERSTSVSIDYGCLSPATIAAMDTYVAWLGSNERSGPVIMVSEGADITRLSTDGIDFRLAAIKNPKASYGFFFKESGHLFYQITFYDPKDNFSLTYDFNTKSFFSPTDENMNYHIAKTVAFFNNTYYFVSINDGSIYNLSSMLTTYDYTATNSEEVKSFEIPRARVCPSVRNPDGSRFCINSLTFTVDQGNDPGITIPNPEYLPRIDMSLSKDGGQTFGSYASKFMKSQGNRRNRVVFWQLGSANDFVCQFRFWSTSYIAVTDGVISAYQ